MTPEALYQLHLACVGLPKPEALRRRREFARLHGLAEDTVRRKLKRLALGRGARREPGVTPALQQAAETVWRFKWTPDGPLPTELAQQIAIAEGALAAEHPVSSLNQAARRLGLTVQEHYARRLEAGYANQAHRVDASGSRHFRVVGREGDDWLLQVCRKEQRNKRWKDAEMLWMLALIDDYSRLLRAAYVVAPGESAELVQHFCVETWRDGPVRGMPETVICDQGAFGKHGSTRALLDFFGIALVMGTPENSRRNGRVERPFRPLKEAFERSFLQTHGLGARVRLSSLKEELRGFIDETNDRRHPIRQDRSKREDWERSIAFRELRACPADALRLAVFRETRTVTGEGWVWHEKRALEIVGLPAGLRGRRVTLLHNREGELVAEHEGARYAVRPAAAGALGTYAGPAAQPGEAVARDAAARPRSRVGIFSTEGRARLRTGGGTPTASGQPVQRDADAPRIATPAPRVRKAVPRDDPFDELRAYRDLKAARRRIDEIVGVPLHTRPEFDAVRLAALDKRLLATGLSRREVEQLGHKLKQAIGL